MDWRPPVYLTGPMRGKPENNYPLFNLVAATLRATGWTVENPAEHFNGEQDRQIHEYLAADVVSLILYSRAIVQLPDWEGSEGARLEAQIALNLRYDLFAWVPVRGLCSVTRDHVARGLRACV